MSIFGDIVGKIFGTHVTGAAQASMAPAASPGSAPKAPAAAPAGAASATPAASAPASISAASPASAVDVAAILDALDEESDEDLDWRKSIVDLMKLLDLDSGLSARRELAKELGFTGDTKNTASMNVWLHKQVMTKLAENGGKVPADLKH